MNALVQPLIAACLHRQVIDPHARCSFIASDREPQVHHLDWVVRGLMRDPSALRLRESASEVSGSGPACQGSNE